MTEEKIKKARRNAAVVRQARSSETDQSRHHGTQHTTKASNAGKLFST
jgi:hypothetical protein